MGARRMSARKKAKRRSHKEKRFEQERAAVAEEDKDRKFNSPRPAPTR